MIRTLLDLGIILSRQVVLTFFAIVIFLTILQRFKPLTSLQKIVSSFNSRFILWITVIIFGGIGVWYLRVQGFAGEVEPLVSSLSWLWQGGLPLYHNLDAPYQYSVLYGPSVFLTNGLFLRLLGPTLFSAKLASLLAALASLLFVYASLAEEKNQTKSRWAVIFLILLYWAHGFGVYLVRPDALLVFATSMGIYLAARGRRAMGTLGLAALLGFAVNLKIHSFLYFIPILFLAKSRWGWKWALGSAIGAIPLVLAPFLLFPTISLSNYILWLREAAHHGLVTTDLPLTLRYAFLVLLPWVGLLLVTKEKGHWDRQVGVSFLSFLAAMGPVILIAAKPGAGPVHLMPLIPIAMVMVGRAWPSPVAPALRTLYNRGRMPFAIPLVAASLTIFLAGSINGYRSTRLVAWELRSAKSLATEVKGIMAKYDGLSIAMACGGENAAFRETWIRPLLVFADQPVLIDPISVMDRCLAGIPLSAGTIAALKSGQIKLWLVPRGQTPFAKTNWYPPHDEIFSATFRNAFTSNYEQDDQTEHFDLWFWNGPPTMVGSSTLVRAGGDNSGVMAPSN